MEARLPAHVEVSGLIRRVQAEGGFAAVLQKGEPDHGTILVILCENGGNARLFERMPSIDGPRLWHCAQEQDPQIPEKFSEYLERRRSQDRDAWLIELDIAEGERFIAVTGKRG